MNTSIKTILAAITMGATAIAAQAQGQPATPKVLTVDLGAVFQGYYRTVEENNKLILSEQQAQKVLDASMAEVQALAAKFKDAQAAFQNPVATDTAKQAAQTQMNAILQDAQKKEQDINNFRQQIGAQIQQNMQAVQQQLLADIAAKATDIGKAKGATMIAARNALVYADPAMDITQEVITALNAGHAMPTPILPPTPAATGTAAPAVSYPGSAR